MAELRDVVNYILEKYPYRRELSKARLTKMVYLADWKSVLERGRQLTGITWVFNHYGPYVDDVVNAAKEYPEFDIEHTTNIYGSVKDLITLKWSRGYDSLSSSDKAILDFVIDITKSKDWEEFMRLVYSTYPVASQPRYSELDLPKLAAEYGQIKPLLSVDGAQPG